jgi:DNA-binding NarL/FixJ family response regulator
VISEVPEPLRRLNVVLEAMFIAHETIYDLHRGLVSADRTTARSRSLLAESARIVLQSAPEASAAARALASQWHEQSVLDPDTAEVTAQALETEFAHAEPLLRELLDRESAIASELRVLATERR